MKFFRLALVCLILAACSPGDPLPAAGPDQKKVSLLFVMNCVNASHVRTSLPLGSKKRSFANDRYQYWIRVKTKLFHQNVDKDAIRRMEVASIDQTKYDEELNLGRAEKIEKYWPVLERCAAREVPFDQMEVDYGKELL